mgnify:CR=1 FL=1
MKKFGSALSILITVLMPLFLLMTSARIIMSPFYLEYEYQLPHFPPDEFGFSTDDRLKWGKISLDFLFNQKDIEFLASQKLDDGSVLYNERELSHMLDVKNLVQVCLKVWYGIIAFIILAGIISWKTHNKNEFLKGVSRGGWLTVAFILFVLAAVMIDFNALFAGFHAIFFTGDSWLFYIDDTLIRLFPEKLWSDAFTFVGIFTLVGALLCGLFATRSSQHK